MGGSVKDIDRGWKRLRGELLKLTEDRAVLVGIVGEEAGKEHGNAEQAARLLHEGRDAEGRFLSRGQKAALAARLAARANTKGPSNVEVATWHEFGTQTGVPERSFIRAPVDANAAKYADMMRKGVERIVDGKLDAEKVLGLVGERAVADMRRAIKAGIAPELTDETIRKKTRESDGATAATPLILTGQLLHALAWVIRRVRPGAEK